MFSTFSHRLSIQIEIFYFLIKYVQSRLLKNCHMRERVKWKSIKVEPTHLAILSKLVFYHLLSYPTKCNVVRPQNNHGNNVVLQFGVLTG